MLNKYKGCLLGAVLGDALGMPYETGPARRGVQMQAPVFGRAYHGHPNHNLLPGQYTDDGQIILIVSRILAGGRFNGEVYAKELLRAYSLKKFRYPDGTIFAACKKMENTKNMLGSGISSDSAGCVALAIPFALRFRDRKEMAKELLAACSITHTHPAAQAATLGFALLLNKLIETGDVDAAFSSLDVAAMNMDADLSSRLRNAYRFEGSGMSIEEAAAVIGTSSSVYQTLPMAMFLCRRCYAPAEVFSAAMACGGNADTIAMICGAFVGARFGLSALPEGLVKVLERAGIFEELAVKLFERSEMKEGKEEKEVPAPAEEGKKEG